MTEERHDHVYNYKRCGTCGGWKQGSRIVPLNVPRCECERVRRFGVDALSDVDPQGLMTLDSLENPHESLKKGLRRVLEIAKGEETRGLFMYGLPGRGKTHIAVALVRACRENNIRAGYFNVVDLISAIHRTYTQEVQRPPTSREKIMRDVAYNRVVVLDDLGKEQDTPHTRTLVYELINDLYKQKRTLVVSTNLSLKELKTRYDSAVLSRFKALTNGLHVEGEDRREDGWEWL